MLLAHDAGALDEGRARVVDAVEDRLREAVSSFPGAGGQERCELGLTLIWIMAAICAGRVEGWWRDFGEL